MPKKNVVLKELSKVSNSYKDMETADVVNSIEYWDKEVGNNMPLLYRAQRCYDDMRQARIDYLRCKDFTYGEQWNDLITFEENGSKVTMSEKDYMMKQGIMPLTNNLIRRTIRNIVGVYRNQDKEETCAARDRKEQQYGEVLSTLLTTNNQANQMKQKSSRGLESALQSGFGCFKHTVGWKNHKFDCWTSNVSLLDFFCDNNVKDGDGDDFRLIGELHSISFQELCASFAKSTEDIKKLKAEYIDRSNKQLEYYLQNQYRRFGQKLDERNFSFFVPDDPNLCRVIEVWTKESRERYHCWDKATGDMYDIDVKDFPILVTAVNAARIAEGIAAGMIPENVALVECDPKKDWFIDEYWYYRFLTPSGHTLQEGETPYAHGEHPYSVFLYPFVDGELHPYVKDVIPQQKLINRSITMNDWIDRCSAKGVLLYPEGAFDGQDEEDVARAWSSPNGVLPYKYKAGVPEPHQVSANATTPARAEMLNIQLKMFEDESGVNGALQGKPGYSTTSGTLYAQQTQNATISISDLIMSWDAFLIRGAYKTLENILQYYDDDRIVQIAGEAGVDVKGNAGHVRNVIYDINIIQSTTSPTYRAIANDYLIQFWQAGQITMEQLLENGNFPFADGLLQQMKAQQADGQQMGGMPQQQSGGMPYITKDQISQMNKGGQK